jgi:hypothetical protein
MHYMNDANRAPASCRGQVHQIPPAPDTRESERRKEET